MTLRRACASNEMHECDERGRICALRRRTTRTRACTSGLRKPRGAGIMRSNDLQITGFTFRLAQKRDLTRRARERASERAQEADSRRYGELMDNMCPRAGTSEPSYPLCSPFLCFRKMKRRVNKEPRDFGLLNTCRVGADFT